ncbi:MAG: histidine kinase [Xanthomonadaceae bacterium]|nr:histidine kinase [Xanthomonadaceae bacterium]
MATADDRPSDRPLPETHATIGLLTRLETERRQIAQSLHDRSCQSLTACLLLLESSETAIDDETRLDLIAELRDALEQVRALSRRLKSPSLADGDLSTPLQEWLSQLKVSFHFAAPVDFAAEQSGLNEGIGLLAFRLIQDAVTGLLSIPALPQFSIFLEHSDGHTRVRLTAPLPCGAHRQGWPDILVPGFFGLTQALAELGGNCRMWHEDEALHMELILPCADRY